MTFYWVPTFGYSRGPHGLWAVEMREKVGGKGRIQGISWLGGDVVQKGLKFVVGEQATAVMELLLLCRPSEARSLENKASSMAGVLLGIHIICRWWRLLGGLELAVHCLPYCCAWLAAQFLATQTL